MSDPTVRVLDDADALAVAAAEAVAEHAGRSFVARGAFRLAVPGGRSPRGLLAVLAAPPFATSIDWPRVTVLLADERALPLDDPGSNARLVREVLLAPLGARAPRFVPMRADGPDLVAAARAYETELAAALDLVVLGVGEDGHIASLFPGSPLLSSAGGPRVAVVHDSPKPPASRLTITRRVLNVARALLVLASGAEKAAAVAAALAPGADPGRVPAALARGGTWLLDREAAAQLPAEREGA